MGKSIEDRVLAVCVIFTDPLHYTCLHSQMGATLKSWERAWGNVSECKKTVIIIIFLLIIIKGCGRGFPLEIANSTVSCCTMASDFKGKVLTGK